MSGRGRRALWALVAAGTGLRLALAFSTSGLSYDIHGFVAVRDALSGSHLHAYGQLVVPGGYPWPYPAGFFPFIGLADLAAKATGLAYTSLVRVPSILADAGIALLVQDFLGRRGRGERERLAATALVMLGPSFVAISGYHGQVDDAAILPAVAALVLWERFPPSRRALWAGLLIGLGGAMKTVPLLMLIPLLPAVRSRREGLVLLAAAAAVPVLVTAPFYLATPHAVVHALHYNGVPGMGGLGLVLQPGLATRWLSHYVAPNSAVLFAYDHTRLIIGAALAAVCAFVFVRRRRPEEAAVLVWLAFYVVSPSFFFQYLVWGLPFFIMARRYRLALAAQALVLVPMILFYTGPGVSSVMTAVYVVAMLALWVLFAAALGVAAARVRIPARPAVPAPADG